MKKHINYPLLIIVSALVVWGILFLAALSAVPSLQFFGNTYYYLLHQFIALLIGLILALIVFKLPLRYLKKISPILLIINLLILVAVLFFGSRFGGATRWLSLGGITFQPSEFLKITAVLYLSALIASKYQQSPKKGLFVRVREAAGNFSKVFLPFLALLAVIIFIFAKQPDISTMGVVVISLLAVYFTAKTPLWHTLLVFLMGIGSALFLILFRDYRYQRLKVFLNPGTDPTGIGYQLNQSLISLGSGGFWGKGLGMSVQKFAWLPQAMRDSVFAVLGEELGIWGGVLLLVFFVALFVLTLKIAAKSKDTFAKLTAVGIAVWLTSQAFMNIASSIGFFPLTGIPLPFFSYGGSHLIAELIGIGILLNISKNS